MYDFAVKKIHNLKKDVTLLYANQIYIDHMLYPHSAWPNPQPLGDFVNPTSNVLSCNKGIQMK